MYFLVSRPRIARGLCFLMWTEQIAYLFFYFNLSKKKKLTCLPGLLAITLVSCFVLDCPLICSFVMLPPIVFMYNLFFFISRFQTIFSPFFALWILLASQPRLARVSCFIRRAERTRSPVRIHGCKYRPIFSDNRLFLSFILARSLLTDCVLKLLYIMEVTQNGGNAYSSWRGFVTKFFKIQTLRTATRYSET